MLGRDYFGCSLCSKRAASRSRSPPRGSCADAPSVDETTTTTTSQNVNFTINLSGTPLPGGNYAFQIDGDARDGTAVPINGGLEIVRGILLRRYSMRLRCFIQAFLEASHQDFGVKRGAECAGLFLRSERGRGRRR
jgi:hypothetical protein